MIRSPGSGPPADASSSSRDSAALAPAEATGNRSPTPTPGPRESPSTHKHSFRDFTSKGPRPVLATTPQPRAPRAEALVTRDS